MKKRWTMFVAAMLCITLLLAGCQAAAPAAPVASAAPAATMAAVAPGSDLADEPPVTEEGKSGQGDSAMPILDPGNAAQSGKKIIYTVQMGLEAPDAARAIDDITSRAIALGGYVSQSSFTRFDGGVQNGFITVRIPPEKLREFTEQLRAGYKALKSDLASQDVTDQYVDVQARLSNAQAQETQLLAVMKQAVKVDDILKVRKELNGVQQEIEQLKGQLRLMDNQVGYSTVAITVQEPPKAPVVQEDEGVVRFLGLEYTWGSIRKGFSNGLNFTLNAISWVFIVVSNMLIPLLAVAVMVFLIILIVRLAGRAKKRD